MTMRALLIACGLLLALAPAMAQGDNVFVVRRILIDGAAVPTARTASQITVVPAPGAAPAHELSVGQHVAVGARIETGVGVVVELAGRRADQQIVMQPRTRLTMRELAANGTRLEVDEGKASFQLFSLLDFYFSVGSLKKVFAIAKGTRFSVDAGGPCRGGVDRAACVTLTLEEGRLDVETRRPVVWGGGSEVPSSPSVEKQNADDDVVSVADAMQAGQIRTVSLEPSEFALRFVTWAEADRHFAAALLAAREQPDREVLMRALRNRLVVLRLGGRNEEAAQLAAQGLKLARDHGDRRWEFRFLIDQATLMWQERRDRSSLPLFEQAFAMTDVVAAAPADLAALYGRYGGIRFDSRDRARPQDDVDIAEDFMRRSLRLREAEGGERPVLDLSWSHYGLGVLLRIARQDHAAADRHVERAVQIRRQILGSRDDIVTAQMLSDLALGKEQLVYQRAASRQLADETIAAEFADVHRSFEESLGMLSRIFPAADHRSIGAVSRRMADFHGRAAQWWSERGRAAAAAANDRVAAARYADALAVFERVSSNTSAERRFAHLGLGRTELRRGQPGSALRALRRALELAGEERCAASPEAPSPAWVAELLGQLAVAAERSGDAAAAAAYRRQSGLPDPQEPCSAVAKPPQAGR